MKPTYDVAIVGAGISGLYTGCLLAKKGYSCAIFEAHYIPGGCVQGFKRHGFYFDAGAHLIGSTGSNALLTKLLKEIDLQYPFIPIDPVDRLHFPNKHIDIPLGWKKYKDFLTSLYKNNRDDIDGLFSKMEIIARYCGRKEIRTKYGPMTFQTLLNEFIQTQELKEILSAQWGFLGERPDAISALSMSIMLVGYIRDGASYAKGGAQRFCNVLANKYRELGGHLFLSNTIKSGEISNGRIMKITTSTNKEIKADFFVWTGNPKNILENFVGAKEAVNPKTESVINSLKYSIKIYSLFLGLNISSNALRQINGWYYSQSDENDWLYIFSPSVYDNSLAPIGKSSLILSSIMPKNIPSDMDPLKKRTILQKKVLTFLKKIIPGIDQEIEVMEDGIPETFLRFTKNPEGTIYGWAPRADNYFDREYLFENQIFDNLYVCGHWAEPGPGVPAVAMSGKMVVEKIEKHKSNDKS